MNSKVKKICAVVSAVAIIGAMGTVFALEDETAAYSYRTGKENHKGPGGEQTFVYSQETDTAEDMADTADYGYRKGRAHRGGEAYGHYDTEALLEAGIIDQATADAIAAYAAQKHEAISELHQGMADMTAQERRTAFEEHDAARKDGIDELVEAGVITAEQGEAIRNYQPQA